MTPGDKRRGTRGLNCKGMHQNPRATFTGLISRRSGTNVYGRLRRDISLSRGRGRVQVHFDGLLLGETLHLLRLGSLVLLLGAVAVDLFVSVLIAPHSTCFLLLLFRCVLRLSLLVAAVFCCLMLLLPSMRTAVPFIFFFSQGGDLEDGEPATSV